MSLGDALIVYFAFPILNLLLLIIFVGIILSWLIAFNVVNAHNQVVNAIWRITNTVTEPLVRPIRSVLPPLGGMDFSPLVLILIIYFLKGYVLPMLMTVI
ncbi:YggT family protein [Woodsholea maritima]|uniref:YggT family protein n=1 Tax=Woodsholea maritima TaxID=240237 RepID=UPI00036AE498|nr:YggT family protein [Woodsholea maritima]